MDDHQLAQLVVRVEQAFPDDPVAQRRAWEFIESVFAAWGEAAAPEMGQLTTATTEGTFEAARGLLEAARALLHGYGGRLASAVQVLLPPTPGLATLARAEAGQTLEVDPEIAGVTGLQGSVTVEYGADFLTLVARVAEESDPSRLGGILSLPDDTVLVQRFERLEAMIATAHFDLPGNGGPLGVVIALFDDDV
jgi:hypothetical protein